ncbi:MAG: HAMP domain-containing sensor histidine kinase [Bacteroidales bacterium]|jgi:two-component system phosphate regulon sensor histidine kinase PhoR|nr:HAMP domain-containing histidine kinase [Bacteroidales bacterium]MDD4215546.1 HAMP domain-containing sensor histidine kinase [Bacteroidales bacterium]
MKKGVIHLIVIIASLSLIGVIITQLKWVDRAIILRTQQFNFMIQTGLTKIENELYNNKKLLQSGVISDSNLKTKDTLNHIDWFEKTYCDVIDTMMKSNFGCFEAHKDYIYGLIDANNEKIICGNYSSQHIQKIFNSKYKISLARVYEKNPYTLAVFFPDEKQLITRKMFIWLLGISGLFLSILVGSFLYIIFNILKQKKISEMKNDFINNMTHELKTPISTISVAAEMLMRPEVTDHCEKTVKYANIIYDENMRLRNQVEQVLQISILDNKGLKTNPTEVDVHRIIENSVDIFNLIVKEKHGIITTDLSAAHTIINVDELHFINVITNMIDNAIKYSQEKPEIKISTSNKHHGIAIHIQDNGLGIRAVDRKHIFKKFFRVHTGDVHNVKGFGLGLFYVKSVIDAHHGTIELIQSEIGEGSVFELYFPFNFNKINNDEHNFTQKQ